MRVPASGLAGLPAVRDQQDEVISRAQARALGMTRAMIEARLTSGRWQVVHRGVYLTRPGPITDRGRIWAAILDAGTGAAAAGHTALWLAGLRPGRLDVLEVVIPSDRAVVEVDGRRARRCRNLESMLHPASTPVRMTTEAAALDVANRAAIPEAVIDVALRVTQQRLTTAARLRDDLSGWPRHRWRGLLLDVLAEVDQGVTSPLERQYLRSVERRHGLPRGVRNVAEVAAQQASRRSNVLYRDVRYPRWRAIVELDGREAHPSANAFRDRRRDNRSTVSGQSTLRYGWREVVTEPCLIAAEVGDVLRANGWDARPRACGPNFDIEESR